MIFFLQILWFLLLGVLLAGYLLLDGFDLGVGINFFARRGLHPSEGSKERGLFLDSIRPFWDGNEVWLVTLAGALFAAFPLAYAAIFNAFYWPLILLLFGLILRGVSIEFRDKLTGVDGADGVAGVAGGTVTVARWNYFFDVG
ncbi:MAG: cytochrome d ubiquinol oxidase subunit II, partial [Oligoflexia bacterium]|nr:cytochrome d ubiquinol oxidase subunit II [Oligoflexia bacterium]